jgi:hypothetical protein
MLSARFRLGKMLMKRVAGRKSVTARFLAIYAYFVSTTRKPARAFLTDYMYVGISGFNWRLAKPEKEEERQKNASERRMES